MTTTITLDWLAFTFGEDTDDAARWICVFASPENSVEIAPTNGYKSAYETSENIRVQWNVNREEMGHHVIISGSAIRNITEQRGMDQQTLLQTVLNAGGKITRLDLAKDATDEEINLDAIYRLLEMDAYEGTARNVSQIHSNGGGNTIYVGSRQSEKFIRIYDKAAQIGEPDRQWKRFELECKGMVARALASLIVDDRAWVNAFDTIALHMVNVPQSKDWRKFFEDKIVPIGLPKLEKKSDREKWIQTQVIPAVIRHATENRDSPAVKLLREMLAFLDKSE